MSIGKIEDFIENYAGKKLGINRYFGFEVDKYHIHAKSFTVSNNNKNSIVRLEDIRGHVITTLSTKDIKQVTDCETNFWTVNSTLYLKDYPIEEVH